MPSLHSSQIISGIVIDADRSFPIGVGGTPPFAGGILDTMDVDIALSVRQLKTGAALCMRVRRSSDNTEQDIGFAYNRAYKGYWIDTEALLDFVGSDTGYVTVWYNQGTLSGSTATVQVTGGNQPVIVSAGVLQTKNSRPTVRFNGSKFMNTQYLALLNSAGRAGIFSVAAVDRAPATSGTDGLVWWSTNTAAATPRLGIRIGSSASAQMANVSRRLDSNSTTQLVGRNPFVAAQLERRTAIAYFDSNTRELREQGVTTASGAGLGSGSTSATDSLASYIGYGTGFWEGQISEVIVSKNNSAPLSNPAFFEADQALAFAGVGI